MRQILQFVAWLTIICWSLAASAQSTAAPTPPMGWNSWDSYGTTVTETQVKANADAMSRDLASHGWRYIVVDIQWYEPNAQGHDYAPGAKLTMDPYGRLVTSLNRFQSSTTAGGYKPIADCMHGKGLKIGNHTIPVILNEAVDHNL